MIMSTLSDELADKRQIRESLEDLITNPESLGPDFQPVRRLADDSVVGWQVVSRFWVAAGVTDRATFMQTAIALGLAQRLDWTLRCRALDRALAGGLAEPVHIKPSPSSYGTVPPPRLAVGFSRARSSVHVVAEIHEGALDQPATLRTGVEEFRRWGWDIAVGDLSDRQDFGSLLQKIKPKIATVDLSTPGRSTDDVVKRYVETAQRLGLETLAIGVDSPLRRGEAQALGVTLARGKAVGEPIDPTA
jgi:EAL domain-containing protein (putative c-di-GMP-specific phosphodiesterase class I)